MRAMVEQAVKTKALVSLYYGKAPKYTYYDGHSQGGRQGMKIMQEYPELYDGYMIAQPAPNIAKFGTSALYPQIVMKTELGYTAVEQGRSQGLCRQGRRRQRARRRRLRQGGARLPARSLCLRLRSGARCRGAVRRRCRRRRDRQQCRCGDLHEREGGDGAEQDLVRRHADGSFDAAQTPTAAAARRSAPNRSGGPSPGAPPSAARSPAPAPTTSRWRCRTSAMPPTPARPRRSRSPTVRRPCATNGSNSTMPDSPTP